MSDFLTPEDILDDRYDIQKHVGQTPVAEVYVALDKQARVTRTIQVLTPVVTERPTALARYLTEMQASMQLDHANIARVFDVVQQKQNKGGRIYVVREYLPTGSLARAIVKKRMSSAQAVSIATMLLRALQHAHSKPVLHRAVEPSNILLTDRGAIKLTDFGLGRVLEMKEIREETGLTPSSFAAPEIQERTRPPGIPTDLYGVGVTLYTLLTGRAPTRLADAEAHEDVLPPLWEVIQRATQTDPDERYLAAAEFLDALGAVEQELGDGLNDREAASFDALGADVGHDHPPAFEGREITGEQENPFTVPADLLEIPEQTTNETIDDDDTNSDLPDVFSSRPGASGAPPAGPPLDDVSTFDEGDSVDAFDIQNLGLPMKADRGASPEDEEESDFAESVTEALRKPVREAHKKDEEREAKLAEKERKKLEKRLAREAKAANSKPLMPEDPRRRLLVLGGIVLLFVSTATLGMVYMMKGGTAPPVEQAQQAQVQQPKKKDKLEVNAEVGQNIEISDAAAAAMTWGESMPQLRPVAGDQWLPPENTKAYRRVLAQAPWM